MKYKIPVAVPSLGKKEKKFVLDCLNTNWISSQGKYVQTFEKNFKRTMRYRFVNVFPKSMSTIPVTYGPADILKVSVSFNYDRYIVNG